MKKITLLVTLLVTSLSFGQIFITEIADPNNDYNSRFIELYNIGATDVDLTGYTLNVYFNSNPEEDAISTNLTGTIKAGGFYLIAYNASSFTSSFGFAPDQTGSVNSNGDDNFKLLDADSNVIDMFGVVGEDGSGTCHEFEDGRSERIASVTTGSATWDESEWNINADSTIEDCTSHTNSIVNTTDGIFDPGSWHSITTLSISENTIEGLVVSSANGTITTNKGEIVTIYNVLGQKVSNADLTSGIYVVLVKEGSITASEKIYVQ